MKKFLYVSLMGTFLVTVETSVIAALGDFDNSSKSAVKVKKESVPLTKEAPRETRPDLENLLSSNCHVVRSHIVGYLEMKDILNLGRVNQNLQEIVCTDIFPEKIGPFVRQTLKSGTGAEAFLPAAFAINLLPGDFQEKPWVKKAQEKIKRLSSSSIGQCISLSKILELVAPIANPFTAPSRELFFLVIFLSNIFASGISRKLRLFLPKNLSISTYFTQI
jgi:hypothetical protein